MSGIVQKGKNNGRQESKPGTRGGMPGTKGENQDGNGRPPVTSGACQVTYRMEKQRETKHALKCGVPVRYNAEGEKKTAA